MSNLQKRCEQAESRTPGLGESRDQSPPQEVGPFQPVAEGGGDPPGQVRRVPQQSYHAQRRRKAFDLWRDWVCGKCTLVNAGGVYRCGNPACTGLAAPHQRPRNTWQCFQVRESGELCFANTWEADTYCHGCLHPNPDIPAERRRDIPASCEPRGREQYKGAPHLPAIQPNSHE